MQIITKSIRIIDYEGNQVYSRETPVAFDEYITELISYVNGNTSVRGFKTRSTDTEVISCIKKIIKHKENVEIVTSKTDIIAQRLLTKEIEAQRRVSRMNTNVQKGSLIQALLYDSTQESYTYLLAKVEHSDFVDDEDFSFKSGFSKDKKTIWKSCLIEIDDENADLFLAKIYSNTVAKYWSDDFLELDALVDDESNTTTAFKSIDAVLNRSIRNTAPRDHTVIRNSIIAYFRNHDHFDYGEMLDEVLSNNYQPSDLSADKLVDLRDKLSQLPEKRHFDRQFNSVPAVINARIRRVLDVNEGIQLKITQEIEEGTIESFRGNDGTRYIKIKTNNEATYRSFEP